MIHRSIFRGCRFVPLDATQRPCGLKRTARLCADDDEPERAFENFSFPLLTFQRWEAPL